jgi:hypothetical protein
LEEVQQAINEWTTAAQVLENEADRQSDAVFAGTLRALVVAALTHCQRLTCIAHMVLAEQQRRYQQSVKQLGEVQP